MAKVKGLNVILTADSRGLNTALNDIERSTRSLNRELSSINRSLRFDPKNVNLLEQRQKVLNERYNETSKKLELMRKNQERVNKEAEAGNISREEQRKYNTELEITASRLKGFEEQLKKANEELRYHSSSLGQSSDKLKETGNSMVSVSKKLAPLSAFAAGLSGVAVKAASDWESAWIDVLKVTDGTPAQLEALATGIRNMSKELPVSATEIGGVVEAASKLGVGIDYVEDFAETMVKMEIATGISAADSATALARFAEITNMSYDNVDRLGSVIAELGDSYATTEKEIIDMSMGLAAAGSQVGMHQSDIMALATALSSVGIEAQAGGSAMSKLIVNMELATQTGEGLVDFANVAGVSGEEFADVFQKDATKALSMFIEGLASIDESGGSAIKTLDDMGIKEVRLRDTLLRAANASDVFTGAIKDGSRAWEENTKLNSEAELQAETLANKWQVLKNQITDVAITMGEHLIPHLKNAIDWLGRMTDKFAGMSPGMQEFIVKAVGITAVSAPMLGAFGKIISTLGTVGGGFAKLIIKMTSATGAAGSLAAGATSASGAITASAGGASAAIGGVGKTVGVVAKAAAGALNMPVVALAGIGLAAGAAGIAVKNALSKDAVESVDLFADHYETSVERLEDGTEIAVQEVHKISDATKELVGQYQEMSSEVEHTTNEMYTGIVEITDESIEDLKEKVNGMNEFYEEESTKQKDKQLEILDTFFNEQSDLTEEEQKQMQELIESDHEERIKKREELEAELLDIMNKAKEQKEGLTQEQKDRISEINKELAEDAVDLMTENEKERDIILGRMHDNEERMNAESASEIIKELNKLNQETIDKAKQRRDEQIRAAEELRRKGGKEAEKTADKMIKEANRQYNQTVDAAEKSRKKGIEKLEKSYGKLSKTVDYETGEILSRWGRIKKSWENYKPSEKSFSVRIQEFFTRSGKKHNDGLSNVPYNNYPALLHRGERVLTAAENRQLDQRGYIGDINRIANDYSENPEYIDNSVIENNFTLAGTYIVREEADIDRIAEELYKKTKRRG